MWASITNFLDHLFVPMFFGGVLFPLAYKAAEYAFRNDEDIGWLFQERWWLKPAFYCYIAMVTLYPFTSPTFCQNVYCRSEGGQLRPKPPASSPIFNPSNTAPPVSR